MSCTSFASQRDQDKIPNDFMIQAEKLHHSIEEGFQNIKEYVSGLNLKNQSSPPQEAPTEEPKEPKEEEADYRSEIKFFVNALTDCLTQDSNSSSPFIKELASKTQAMDEKLHEFAKACLIVYGVTTDEIMEALQIPTNHAFRLLSQLCVNYVTALSAEESDSGIYLQECQKLIEEYFIGIRSLTQLIKNLCDRSSQKQENK